MSLLHAVFRRLIKKGVVTLVEADGSRHVFGSPDPFFPDIVVRFNDRRVAFDIVRGPRLGFAEGFMDGRISFEKGDIMDFVGLIRANNPWEKGLDIEKKGPLRRAFKRATRRWNQINFRRQSKRNVAHHYDLSGKLYDLFLDRDRQYSCAYFTDPANSLEQAQEDKKAHIAAKLALSPGQKVLDIGCGWGGMALYLHKHYGVDVLGITLSEEQLEVAQKRAAEAGVSDHVRFELRDYRDLAGSFDRIVSVGMFEHVGVPNYREFFRKCHNLLTSDGVMLLHTIGRMAGPGSTDAFTRKYIFPGGYIPALSEILEGSEPNRMIATDVEVLRLHYAFTLQEWYRRTVAAREQIEALYDERFFRMWTLYLAGAATVFQYGGMVNFQIQYARSRHALPITRDYMMKSH
ncbi:SAM-dependent methyltransferase [Aquisediminimonas profunda]|uniref:SAM-dependent methyltransferase n=1 Tax=Aquisediminimonas profunda TaxID=1550733 RepID=UPI001C62B678|nr:cyclopropane-fatty-acyl-phospholipid synthase family protein [Aquisediminimonas profunda]